MAEVLGIVASGINVAQLAGQVTSSIIKLKDYWNQIQDAPADINRLFREIESLNLILCHIQNDRAGWEYAGGNVGMQKSLELCIEGTNELGGLVNQLREKVEGKKGWKKRVGAMKVVLKKDEIKDIKRRMKSAIRLLSLSYQCHTSAMIQLQPEIIVARVSSHVNSLIIENRQSQDFAPACRPESFTTKSTNVVVQQYNNWTTSSSWTRYLLGSYQYWKRKEQYKGREREELGATLTVPFWPERILDFRGYETLSGWRFNFQTYRILPPSSPFIDAVEGGDINLVRTMLASREASVTDRFTVFPPYIEETALHLAARKGNIEMCRLLLQEGADPLACDGMNRTPLHKATSHAGLNTFLDRNQPWEIARILLSKGADDVLIDDITVVQGFFGPRSMFKFLQQHMYPPYREISPQTRFDIAAALCRSRWHNAPAIISTLLRVEADFDKELLTLTNRQGNTLLHLLVMGLVDTNYIRLKEDPEYWDDDLSSEEVDYLTATKRKTLSWRPLIRKVISANVDLNALDNQGRTPLCVLIQMCSRSRTNPRFKYQCLWDLLKCWLEDLLNVGIDLLQYGALENLAVQKGRDPGPPPECACFTYFANFHPSLGPDGCTRTNECCSPTRLINFHYGPRPEDWIFWLSEETDEFAGQFWSMVEDPLEFEAEECPVVFKIPGSWNEAEDCSSDE